MEASVEGNFHAENENLPSLSCDLTSEQRSHFDPRYTTEEKEVNTDAMATRSALVALEHLLQTTAYEKSQRRAKASNLSHDLLMINRMIAEGIKAGKLGGTKIFYYNYIDRFHLDSSMRKSFKECMLDATH